MCEQSELFMMETYLLGNGESLQISVPYEKPEFVARRGRGQIRGIPFSPNAVHLLHVRSALTRRHFLKALFFMGFGSTANKKVQWMSTQWNPFRHYNICKI